MSRPNLSGTDRMAAPSSRFIALDGLRGVAATIVVVFHLLSAFTPQIVPDQHDDVPWWADMPTAVLYNGTFSVHVFFVLSGFVLAHASCKARETLCLDLVLRYIRLALPATVSALLAWMLLTAFPEAAASLSDRVPGRWLQWTHQQHIPPPGHAVYDGLIGAFVSGSSQFNNVLWTLRYELIGSLGIYLAFHLGKRTIAFWGMVVVALLAVGANTAYVSIASGALVYLLWTGGWRLGLSSAMSAFALGLIIGSQSTGFSTRLSIDGVPDPLKPGNKGGWLYPAGASLVVVGVLSSPTLQKLFSIGACVFLGKISFALYLVHVPLIYTVCIQSALAFSAVADAGLILVFAASIVLCLAVAVVFELVVDRPVLALNTQIKRLWTRSGAILGR